MVFLAWLTLAPMESSFECQALIVCPACSAGTLLLVTSSRLDKIEIARGTKQGDPLSSLLFYSVLLPAMEKDTGTWNDKGLGIKLGDEKRDCISNLRFADDVLMMANPLK